MIIEKITVKNFGKLQDKTISLKNGVNLIYGPNEAGKSTLMDFIKIMLYSRRKGLTTTAEDKFLRNKYLPWKNGCSMCGVLEFAHGGNDYILQKEINPTSVLKDVTLLKNQSLGEKVNLGKREEVGEHLFSLDLASFERSSFIENLGKSGFENVKASDDSILNKMLNISETGEDEVCVIKLMSRITDAMKDLERLRGKSGKIPALNSRIKETKKEIENLKELEKLNSEFLCKALETKNLIERKKQIENKIESLEKLRKISDIRSLMEKMKENKLCKEKYGSISRLENTLKNLNSIKKEIDSYEHRVNEQENLIASSNCTEITEKEIESLNVLLNKKENLKNRFEKFISLLGFKSPKELENSVVTKDLIEKYEAEKRNLENLRKKEFETSENQNEHLEKLLSEKSKLCKEEKIVTAFSLVGFLISLIFAPIWITSAAALFSSYMIYRVFKSYKLIKSLNENIKKQDNENQILKTYISKMEKSNEKLKSIKNEILNLIENEKEKLSLDIKLCNENIAKFLKGKNAHSIKEFYDIYAKFQSLSQSKILLSKFKDKLKTLKADFIEITLAYKDNVNTFDEAVKFFNHLSSEKAKIDNQEKEISLQSKVLRLENLSLEELKSKLETLKSTAENLNREDAENLKSQLENLKNLNLEDAYIEIMKKIKKPQKNIRDLEYELSIQNEKLNSVKNYFKSLEVAGSIVEKASAEIRKNFNPKLNEEASKIFSKLTGKKYEKVCVEKNYGMLVEDEMMQRDCQNLSSGTIDQAYLSLRLAISKLISKNQVPIILDDTLVRYDYERMNNTLEFFNENIEIPQTIIFTCHDYIVNAAKEKNINVISI